MAEIIIIDITYVINMLACIMARTEWIGIGFVTMINNYIVKLFPGN